MTKYSFLVAAILSFCTVNAVADGGEMLEEVTIIGDRDGVMTGITFRH